ncbi:MAG: helix-turn-helix transcriptional regulator [Clostridiales bacterium]|nr:helix-turn-helix transcriptional regulator [Clostridiales bacterium]
MLERLRNLREDRDLSQKDMAEVLNVAQTTYSDYELEKINIPLNTLKQLAIFFNTSIDYLLELTDNPSPYERAKKHRL